MRSRISGWWPRPSWPCLFLAVFLFATSTPAQQPPVDPFFTNLLVNPDAETGNLSGWQITANGGAGWAVIGDPGQRRFLTSYAWSSRIQVVDLYARGFTQKTLAQSPLIVIREEVRHMHCPDPYGMRVELLDVDMNVVTFWDSGVRTTTGPCVPGLGDVVLLEHTFRDYGPSVRYVRWSDGGQDSEHWGGHYGVALDNAMLTVFDDNHPSWFNNLLENGGAETGNLDGWQVDANGGAGWLAVADPDQPYFITSYAWNLRHQLVDLWEHGFDPDTLARQPLIRVSERFTQTYCPGDAYFLKAQLLDENLAVVASWDSGVRTHEQLCSWGEKDWVTLSHVFADYGPNVRYVRFEDGGKDGEQWGGQYGTILDDAALVVFGENLLTNPGVQTGGLTGWQLAPTGAATVVPAARDGISGNLGLQTQATQVTRTQVVDLVARGVSDLLLDSEPTLFVSGLYRSTDCVSPYFLKVSLLDASQQVITSWDSGPQLPCQQPGGDWEELSHAFEEMPPDVRFVRWEDGARHGVLDAAFLGIQNVSDHAPHMPHRRSLELGNDCGGAEQLACWTTIWRPGCTGSQRSCSEGYYSCERGYEAVWTGASRQCQASVFDCCRPAHFIDPRQGNVHITQGHSAQVFLNYIDKVFVPHPTPTDGCPQSTPLLYRSVGKNYLDTWSPGDIYTGNWREVPEYAGARLMFNANFFDVSVGQRPYSSYCTQAKGLVISEGVLVSPAGGLYGQALETLVFYTPAEAMRRNRPAEIRADVTGANALLFRNAVSGFRMLRDGKYVTHPNDIDPICGRPRTAVGLTREGDILVVAVINPGQDAQGSCVQDGTTGSTTRGLAAYMKALGAWDALTLDGSGSSQLAYFQPNAANPSIKSLPSDVRSSPTIRYYRPVPVFLGFE
ncbi:phosphodiester glycosidase family protein [Myxococcus sp. CA056]|uniref:phosphodiester glycosidase family protein n=1 Tax=Myxococcus sp. CA056 TaxID=2741740 RepID=UPI00157ADE53|nr:phosphodiester glycosidase family protein [Myxococcus sp. CA056]NTX16375.1 phosphodiester glycosidase family protein [Myxococcus sp. CA056]